MNARHIFNLNHSHISSQLYQHVNGKETSLAKLLVNQGWAREVVQTRCLSGADDSSLERTDFKHRVHPG